MCRIGHAKKVHTAFIAISLCSVRIYGDSPAEGLTRKLSEHDRARGQDRKNERRAFQRLETNYFYSMTYLGIHHDPAQPQPQGLCRSGRNPYGMRMGNTTL